MELSLNQIIQKLEDFVSIHAYYKSFAFGTDSQINTEVLNNTNLPFLYCVLRRVSLNENTMDYSFTFKSLDTRSKAETDNLKDVISDQIRNLNDVRQYLIYGEVAGAWTLSSSFVSINPLVNVTNDYLSGCEMEITLSTGLIQSDCQIPFEIPN
jgi:hypothetical protein